MQRPGGQAPPSRTRAPAAAAPQRASKYKEKVVKFRNPTSGHLLAGTLTQVDNQNRAVILCHGFASHRNSFHFPALAARFADRNVASMRLDFQGNGDSEGDFQFGNYSAEASDIRAAVEYLRSQAYNVIGLVGHSKGAGSVLIYASQHDDVPHVVNLAGRFHMDRGIKERFGDDILERLDADKAHGMETKRDDGEVIEWTLTKWSMKERRELDMAQVARGISVSEVLTVHGSKDRVIPVADAQEWGKHIAAHRLVVVEGGDHNFVKADHANAMMEATVAHCVD